MSPACLPGGLHSNRLGIRMEGPRPKFARADGGEGGSHPSNVHDHVYAIGALRCRHSLQTTCATIVWHWLETMVPQRSFSGLPRVI